MSKTCQIKIRERLKHQNKRSEFEQNIKEKIRIMSKNRRKSEPLQNIYQNKIRTLFFNLF